MFSVKRTAGDYSVENGVLQSGASAQNNVYLRVKEYGEQQGFQYLLSSFPTADMGSGTLVDFWEYYVSIFYIRNFSTAGDGIPTLTVERLIGNAMQSEALVEGIEDMQIEFGIDSDTDYVPNQYKAAPTLADMANVVTARIFLLVRSVNTVPGYTDDKTYTLGSSAPVTKNDGFLRRIFKTTVQMRNAVLPNESQ